MASVVALANGWDSAGRRSAMVAAALAAFTLLSRLPFSSQNLWAWDSVLYARSLEGGFHVGFDLAEQRPHPPGYLFYVAAASAFRGVVGDTNAALVLLSAVASALGAAAVYLLARRLAGGGSSLLAAAGFAWSPLVWHYSEVAYPYTTLGALTTVLALSFWAARNDSSDRAAFASSAALGLLSGFRQDLLVLLGPLWLWTMWPGGARRAARAAVVVAAGALVWLVPTVLLSGGPIAYLEAVLRQADWVNATYSVSAQGLEALGANARMTAYALAWGFLPFAIPLTAVAAAATWRMIRLRRIGASPRYSFLAIWTLPPLAVYVLVHIGEWGYVLSVLPGLFVLMAVALDRVVATAPAPRRSVMRVTGAALVVAPALLFVFAPVHFSAASIATHDLELTERVRYVRAHFPSRSTVMLAREDYLVVRYYLPEYRAWLYDPGPYGSTPRRKRAALASTLVVFTRGLTPRQDHDVRYAECAKGVRLTYLDLEPGWVLELEEERYSVTETPLIDGGRAALAGRRR